jgi:hypothetical protein
MSAAAGTMLAASITATALVVSNDAAARTSSAHRSTRLFGLAGDVSGAAGPNADDRQANEQFPPDELSRDARQYESKAQVAQQARAAAQAARRAEAVRRARVLAAGRQAARRAAAERAAETPPAPEPSAGKPPTADSQPKTASPAAPSGSPQQIATAMLADFGWSSSEFGCLNELWERESGWNPSATNPYSGAYGIPQALPGAKMASAGADWATNAATQIKWGLGYIKATYGSPCAAWSHETADGWY